VTKWKHRFGDQRQCTAFHIRSKKELCNSALNM